jgi:hypothetical protein
MYSYVTDWPHGPHGRSGCWKPRTNILLLPESDPDFPACWSSSYQLSYALSEVDVMCSLTWCLHGGDYEECRLLVCDMVWLLHGPTFRRNVSPPLLVTANIVPSSLILVTLMVEALRSSETSIPTRATWCHIPEGGIFYSLTCLVN